MILEKWIINNLTMDEIKLINERIYFNPDHIDYYIAYKCGEYDKCIEYLKNNRHLLK